MAAPKNSAQKIAPLGRVSAPKDAIFAVLLLLICGGF